MVEIVEGRIRVVAEFMKNVKFPEAREQESDSVRNLSLKANFYLMAVAICHQTQTLGGCVKDVELRGWDFLKARLAERAEKEPSILMPLAWSSVDGSILDSWFTDRRSGTSISNPNGRAALLNDLGTQFLERRWDSADQIRETCGTIDQCLLLLSEFRAFSDPVQKKSLFLLSILQNNVGWTFEDSSILAPPVDYHEVRGHLRLGTVSLTKPCLEARVMQGEPISEAEDIAIRAATREAIVRIAEQLHGLSPGRLHYAFWNFFRQRCTREAPKCHRGLTSDSLPVESMSWLEAMSALGECCPFHSCCYSFKSGKFYIEPTIMTDWY
jgi:hypothetical protein